VCVVAVDLIVWALGRREMKTEKGSTTVLCEPRHLPITGYRGQPQSALHVRRMGPWLIRSSRFVSDPRQWSHVSVRMMETQVCQGNDHGKALHQVNKLCRLFLISPVWLLQLRHVRKTGKHGGHHRHCIRYSIGFGATTRLGK
jgi:hypothetical protein